MPFDKDKAIKDIRNLNPQGDIFEISCTAKDGLAPWLTWIREQMEKR